VPGSAASGPVSGSTNDHPVHQRRQYLTNISTSSCPSGWSHPSLTSAESGLPPGGLSGEWTSPKGRRRRDVLKYWTPLVDGDRSWLPGEPGLTPAKTPARTVEQDNGVQRWPVPAVLEADHHQPGRLAPLLRGDWLRQERPGHLSTPPSRRLAQRGNDRLRKAHLEGRTATPHPSVGPCTDGMGMRWSGVRGRLAP